MPGIETIRIKVTTQHEIPVEESCSNCGFKNGDVFCDLFGKIIRLDGKK